MAKPPDLEVASAADAAIAQPRCRPIPAGDAIAHDTSVVRGALADLAERLAVAPAAITVIGAWAVTWGDASYGCPEPGVEYLQRRVDGVAIVLEHAGRRHEYRGGPPPRLCGSSPNALREPHAGGSRKL